LGRIPYGQKSLGQKNRRRFQWQLVITATAFQTERRRTCSLRLRFSVWASSNRAQTRRGHRAGDGAKCAPRTIEPWGKIGRCDPPKCRQANAPRGASRCMDGKVFLSLWIGWGSEGLVPERSTCPNRQLVVPLGNFAIFYAFRTLTSKVKVEEEVLIYQYRRCDPKGGAAKNEGRTMKHWKTFK